MHSRQSWTPAATARVLASHGVPPEAISPNRSSTRVASAGLGATPLARVECADEATVVAAMKACNKAELPVTILGGGFSPSGLGQVSGTVCLDLQGLDHVTVDSERALVTIGGGVSAGMVDRALDGTGLMLNLPVPSRVGVAGALLAGGVGVLLRQTGFLSDQLVSARVVDADGP